MADTKGDDETGEDFVSAADLLEDNINIIKNFGAVPITQLHEMPDFYTFSNGLIYSHRDFDTFYAAMKNGDKSAVVSGLNASSLMHIGHLAVFDTNLFFQKKFGLEVFVPISDDESYVSMKVKTQEEGVKNAFRLAKCILALGFETSKTRIIIDHIYTDIYNTAIKLSRGMNISNMKATYGYSSDQNVGLHFYPSIQAAHIVLPQTLGMRNVLVPIASDEDTHLRICRDVVEKFGYAKPAVLHTVYLPGLDGKKMSKSKGNAIFLNESDVSMRKKVMAAFSGGQSSIEEHRRLGGNPAVDVAYIYLKSYFLDVREAQALAEEYRKGMVLSGEMKGMLVERLEKRIGDFRERYERVTPGDLEKVIMRNGSVDIKALAEKYDGE
jgi:tryptophanyl-tRNA synthetase